MYKIKSDFSFANLIHLTSFINFFILFFFAHSLAQSNYNMVEWDSVSTDTLGQAENTPAYYYVYTDTLPGFIPDSTSFAAATTNTSYTHYDSRIGEPGVHFYYVITCVDSWGNESVWSERVATESFVLTSLKLFLEGPYDESADSMSSSLETKSLLPLSSPYNEVKRNIQSVPDKTVDWVKVDLLDTPDGTALASQAFLLRSDGMIVEPDGYTTGLGFPQISAGDYYVQITHRNHFSVLSAAAITLSGTYSNAYDFTSDNQKYYQQTGCVQLNTTVWGVTGGDADHNQTTDNNDFSNWYQDAQNGFYGYRSSDFNLDGKVTTLDYTIWYNSSQRN